MNQRVTHKALFEKLRDDTVITKCERYAHWTLPQLMANFSETRGTHSIVVERDYQEIGALLVNHLASKLAGLLFPSNRPFYRIDPSDEFVQTAEQAGVKKTELSAALARLEMESCQNLFMNASYNQLVTLLKHLIITGNAVLYRDSEDKKCSTYGLQSFGVRRDGKGRVVDSIIREFTYVESLDLDIQDALKGVNKSKYSRPEQQVEVYTRIQRQKVRGSRAICVVTQEVDTLPVGVPSTYPEHLCPWQFPTWNLIAGEHYGRGMVEDYAGGFARLSDLSESHALYAVEVMRVVHLVGAGSGTDIDDLANAETGEYIRGDAQSVGAHEAGDARKLEQIQTIITEVFQRLARAFMYSANTRDAERVTAYELRQQAIEAENALGGVYSSLAESIQVPLAHILMFEAKPSTLDSLIRNDMRLDIMAGIPALGRASDVQNLVLAVQEAATVVPALAQMQQLDPRVDIKKVMDMIYEGRSVDVERIYKEQDVLDAEAQAMAQQQQGQAQMATAVDAASQLEQLNQMTQG